MFSIGTVTSTTGQNDKAEVALGFKSAGIKRLLLQSALVEKFELGDASASHYFVTLILAT